MARSGLNTWRVADAEALYKVPGWGQGYFGINGRGHVIARPSADSDVAVDLMELVRDAERNGLHLPLLIRFSDILADRLARLYHAFDRAIAKESYKGHYVTVYPVKVNPQRQVVDEVVRFGAGHGIGLEAGSKAELHIVLAMQEGHGQVIVCNGYKDPAYIRLALMAQKLGRLVFLVVEKPAEVGQILRIAREEGIRPQIGIRIKLAKPGAGKWEDSGGDRSKFGLTAGELVQAIAHLRDHDRLDCFRLLHVHLGSQINDIRRIKAALREMARYYAELCRAGCPIEYVDVGGGLGVDYNGSRSTAGFGINYDLPEYASDVVGALARTCRDEGLAHPTIISESGRALTAHHAMLAINVLETTSVDPGRADAAPAGDADSPVAQLEHIHRKLSGRKLIDSWHAAQYHREEAINLFELGYLSLDERAQVDTYYWAIAKRVKRLMHKAGQFPEELAELEVSFADKYFCNFSVFQSLPDSWAIGQEFPVLPLHRLDERPNRSGILQDITCDSDGKIGRYVGDGTTRATLSLHTLLPGEPYVLGVFLTGAYQEILGDLHNLFGDTNAIHVAFNDDGSWRYEQIIRGQNVADVLDYVQFHHATLVDRITRQVQAHVAAGDMTPLEGKTFIDLYEAGMRGGTYLEPTLARKSRRRGPSAGSA